MLVYSRSCGTKARGVEGVTVAEMCMTCRTIIATNTIIIARRVLRDSIYHIDANMTTYTSSIVGVIHTSFIVAPGSRAIV